MLLKDIYLVKNSIEKLMNVSFDCPKKNYQFFTFVKAANKELDFLSNETIKLFQSYGQEENPAQIKPEYKEICDEKFNEILDLEISELPDIGITLEDIIECKYPPNLPEEAMLTSNDFAVLEKFFDKLVSFKEE